MSGDWDKLVELVERLRASAQQGHGTICDYGEAVCCPAEFNTSAPCECGATEHNRSVDAHADELTKAIRSLQAGYQMEGSIRQRKESEPWECPRCSRQNPADTHTCHTCATERYMP